MMMMMMNLVTKVSTVSDQKLCVLLMDHCKFMNNICVKVPCV